MSIIKLALSLFPIAISVTAHAQTSQGVIRSGKVGDTTYYANVLKKTIEVLPPWKVRIDVDKVAVAGSSKYYMSVLAQPDRGLTGPDAEGIRAEFPGYQITGVVPNRVQAFQIAVRGLPQPLTLAAPSLSQSYVSANVQLEGQAGGRAYSILKSQGTLDVAITSEVMVPVDQGSGGEPLDLGTICPKSGSNDSFGDVLSAVVENLRPVYAKIETAELRDYVLREALRACLRGIGPKTISTLDDLYKLSVVVPTSPGEIEMFKSVDIHREKTSVKLGVHQTQEARQ